MFIFGEGYRSWSFLPFRPKCLPQYPVQEHFSLCSSLSIRDQVSHSRTTLSYVKLFACLVYKWKWIIKFFSSLKISGYFLCCNFLKMNVLYAFKSVNTLTELNKLNNLQLIEDLQNKPNLSKHNCHKPVTLLCKVCYYIYTPFIHLKSVIINKFIFISLWCTCLLYCPMTPFTIAFIVMNYIYVYLCLALYILVNRTHVCIRGFVLMIGSCVCCMTETQTNINCVLFVFLICTYLYIYIFILRSLICSFVSIMTVSISNGLLFCIWILLECK
jgi:hypothetical protein